MRIRSVRVKNFRSIRDAKSPVGDLTALIGRNGAGKSAFLGALDLFYGPEGAPERSRLLCRGH